MMYAINKRKKIIILITTCLNNVFIAFLNAIQGFLFASWSEIKENSKKNII